MGEVSERAQSILSTIDIGDGLTLADISRTRDPKKDGLHIDIVVAAVQNWNTRKDEWAQIISQEMGIAVNFHPRAPRAAGDLVPERALPTVNNIVLVGSGKGGVGKSTVAVNLAAALSKTGHAVGLMDADVYGPSIPTMLGFPSGARPASIPSEDPKRPKLVPMERYGIKMMSMGFLVDADTPMVWRGPMIASAAMQLFHDVMWGELDYLIVDLPPGTGDIQLSIAQQVHVDLSILVSTPQEVAYADVRRAKTMFDRVSIPMLGLVENMSYFLCDGCDKKHRIFNAASEGQSFQSMGLEKLAEVPLEPHVGALAETGVPAVVGAGDSKTAEAMMNLGYLVAHDLLRRSSQASMPKISISGNGAKKPAGLPILGG